MVNKRRLYIRLENVTIEWEKLLACSRDTLVTVQKSSKINNAKYEKINLTHFIASGSIFLISSVLI